MADRIRTGLIRCDTHGLWYGPMMAEHDAKLLQRPMPPEEKGHYSWQAGGCHKYLYANYSKPLEMTAPFIGGFEIVKVWDEHRDAAEMASRVFLGKPKVCDTFEEVSDDVDLVFIADCNYDGSDHLTLARPGLERGVATFVDKPFADTVEHARQMIELARRHRAPLFSLSILRAEPAVARFRNRIPEVGILGFATLAGYGTEANGLVHTISAAQHLFGTGIETVRALVSANHTAVHLDYGQRDANDGSRPTHGVMIHCDIGPRPLTALGLSIFGSKGDIHETVLGDLVYPAGTAEIIQMIRHMVEIRQAPPLMHEVLESIAIIESFKLARDSRAAVRVAEVLAGGNMSLG